MPRPVTRLTRRGALAAAAAALAAPALAQRQPPVCETGLPGHQKGPEVWGGYDQTELDAAYDQDFYQPLLERTNDRLASLSYDLRLRRGYPDRIAYGDDPVEKLDLYRAAGTGLPVYVFLHGGTWRFLDAAYSGFAAEMFLDRGAHFAALDFADVRQVGGDLGVLADQVRRGIAWLVANAASYGGDPARVYIGGHSSGGHLAAVALTTDWTAFGLPADAVKGGMCMSGMYDLAPVRLSWRSRYLSLTDASEDALSPQRHIDRIRCPVVVSHGTHETPEFQRQSRDFAAALEAAGKPVRLLVGQGYHHQDLWESLGNPYGLNGRAALEMMGL
jgi:arylformamidase